MQRRAWQSAKALSVSTTQMVIGHTYEEDDDIGSQILQVVEEILQKLTECGEQSSGIKQRRCFQQALGRCLELEAYFVILASNVAINQHLEKQSSEALANLQKILAEFIEELKSYEGN